jgi:hypothetical protein
MILFYRIAAEPISQGGLFRNFIATIVLELCDKINHHRETYSLARITCAGMRCGDEPNGCRIFDRSWWDIPAAKRSLWTRCRLVSPVMGSSIRASSGKPRSRILSFDSLVDQLTGIRVGILRAPPFGSALLCLLAYGTAWMLRRTHEIHVGDFLHISLRHFSSGAVRRIKRQRRQRQSYSQQRHETDDKPRLRQRANHERARACACDQFRLEKGHEQITAAKINLRIALR